MEDRGWRGGWGRTWAGILVLGLLTTVLRGTGAAAEAPAKIGQRIQDEFVEFTVHRIEWHKTLKAGNATATPKGEFLAVYMRAENAANVANRSVTPETVTLLDAKNERTVLAREDIEEMKPSAQSLMPEKILDPLTDQEIRDFFSYLQSTAPPGASQTPAPLAPGASEMEQRTLKVCLVSGSLEYKSDESLSALQRYLEKEYDIKCSRAFRKTDDDLPGLENLESCDVALFFTRRLTVSGEQLERIKKYCRAGKPLVALRTASHGFQNWLAFDKEVLGGNYKNHYGAGPMTEVHIVEKAKDHPVLEGVKPFRSAGSLYKNSGVASDVQVLLTGAIPEHKEPIAWARTHNGGRVFYTSLGHPQDFADENFVRMLVNALYWTTKREPPKK